ncbi:MAG: hypothetical protein PSV35_01590, partial [bacterium]|nr:hypothetical protein [bacterium]
MNLMTDITNQILKLQEQSASGEIIVIGISGPTGSGKSTLADKVHDNLLFLGKSVLCFKMDWLLKERNFREEELNNLISQQTVMPFESTQHINLNLVHNFLKQTRHFNKGLLNPEHKCINSEPFILEKVYNRGNGLSNDRKELHLEPNLIILIDGQYNLIDYLDCYINLQIVLLVDLDILLQRLIMRANYREPFFIKQYFFRVNMPSILRYLS